MANNQQKMRALGGKQTFKFNEEEYTVDGQALDDVEVFEMFEEDKFMSAVKKILGAEEFNRFKDNNRNENGRVPMEVFGEFVEAMFSEFNLGN